MSGLLLLTKEELEIKELKQQVIKLGLPDSQINRIVKDVRAADFDSLHKTLKLN